MRHRLPGNYEQPSRFAELTILTVNVAADDPAQGEQPSRFAELTILTEPLPRVEDDKPIN
jgi:hypothetical protein